MSTSSPTGVARRVQPALFTVLALTVGLFAACSSGSPSRNATTGPTTAAVPSTTAPSPGHGPGSPPPGSGWSVAGGGVRITSPAAVSSVTLAVGDTLAFALPPTDGRRPDGSPVTWPAPTVPDHRNLAPQPPPMCQLDWTCVKFKAVAAGTATVSAVGPGGIICAAAGHPCAGVSAADYLIRVTVTQAGPLQVTPR